MQNEITELRNQVRTLKRIVYGFGCLLVAGVVVSSMGCEFVQAVGSAAKNTMLNAPEARGTLGSSESRILTDLGSSGFRKTLILIRGNSIWLGDKRYNTPDFTVKNNQLLYGKGLSNNDLICTIDGDQVWTGKGYSVTNKVLCTIEGHQIWSGKGYSVTNEVLLTIEDNKIWIGKNNLSFPQYQIDGYISRDILALLVAAGVFN